MPILSPASRPKHLVGRPPSGLVLAAVFRVVPLIALLLVLPRPAAAQVDGEISDAWPNPFDYYPADEESFSPYVHIYMSAWWDSSVQCGVDGGCQDVWCDATGAGVGILGDDGAYVGYDVDPGAGWADIALDDYTPPIQMQDLTYHAGASASWSNGEYGYTDRWSDTVYMQARFQSCGDDTKNRLMQEYAGPTYPIHNYFVPQCSDFTGSRHANYFSFSELTVHSDYSIALLRDPLIADSSSGYGMDKWRELYGSARTVNSAYRNPHHNAAVSGAANSRHMYGDAADLNNDSSTYDEWQQMLFAAYDANADYLEGQNDPCQTDCVHADWRSHSGGY